MILLVNLIKYIYDFSTWRGLLKQRQEVITLGLRMVRQYDGNIRLAFFITNRLSLKKIFGSLIGVKGGILPPVCFPLIT